MSHARKLNEKFKALSTRLEAVIESIVAVLLPNSIGHGISVTAGGDGISRK